MQQVEPLSELIDRFTELKLELPKTKKPTYHFSDYLILKLTLCVHSALSRQHVANPEEALQKVLKTLKANFKIIKQTESELIQQQNNRIEALMKI